MEHAEKLIWLSGQLKELFNGFEKESLPNQKFKEVLHAISELQGEDGVEVISGMLRKINSVKNIYFLDFIFLHISPFIKRWMFYLLEEVNSALDIYFEYADNDKIFYLIELIGHKADARTLEIIQRNCTTYKDQKTVGRLMKIRSELERKITHSLRRISELEFAPIITAYDAWYE